MENKKAIESAIFYVEKFPFIPRREIEVKNRNILLDTLNVLKSDEKLSNIVEESSKKNLYFTGKFAYGDLEKYEEEAKVFVSKRSTFEAAIAYDGKVCALNFANFFTPGGGVTYGSTAQEECLCRTSSLLCNLITKESFENFYVPHKDFSNDLANDDIIYSPDVVVVKADNYDLLETPKIVNVITCAAPDIRKIELEKQELYEMHYKRGMQILKVAAANGNEHVVLGAFGCGVFANDPEVVAEAYHDLIDGYFRHAFKTIEFAVYCPRPKDTKNYEAFNKFFK